MLGNVPSTPMLLAQVAALAAAIVLSTLNLVPEGGTKVLPGVYCAGIA